MLSLKNCGLEAMLLSPKNTFRIRGNVLSLKNALRLRGNVFEFKEHTAA